MPLMKLTYPVVIEMLMIVAWIDAVVARAAVVRLAFASSARAARGSVSLLTVVDVSTLRHQQRY
jgi:hypothetical protein